MKSNSFRFIRAGFGVLGLSSLVLEIVVTSMEGTFNFFNFFGFFTVLSNLLASGMLIYLSIRNPNTVRSQLLRGGITLYMLMTGVIFAVLLAGLKDARLTAVPWDNVVLHYIMPYFVLLDWVINPPNTRITFRRAALWLIFPIAYIVYTLSRGAITGWYPYPFLNPQLSSYAQVALSCFAITIFVIASAAILRLRYKN